MLLVDSPIVSPPYIDLILSRNGEHFVWLEADCHTSIIIYCENELMCYGRKNYGSNLVLEYCLIRKYKIVT